MARVVPPDFLADLKRRFCDVVDLRWNEAVMRWELISLTAANTEVSQYWGWYHDPVSGVRIEPDPMTGLVPFRDLLAYHDQQALITNLENGFRFKRGEPQTWREMIVSRRDENRRTRAVRLKQRAQTFADLIAEVDLRRPWRKFHEHRPGQGRVITHSK